MLKYSGKHIVYIYIYDVIYGMCDSLFVLLGRVVGGRTAGGLQAFDGL